MEYASMQGSAGPSDATQGETVNIKTRKIAQDSDSLYLSAYAVIVDGEEIGEVMSWDESYRRGYRHYTRRVWFANRPHTGGFDTRSEAIQAVHLEPRA
jgi:hypothetical protein